AQGTGTTTTATSSAPSPASATPSVATPRPAALGLDASKPELAPEDAGFVDTKEGWGWSDRCWKSLHDGKLGFAKAQCAEGLKFAKSDGSKSSARPSLIYNLGLIEEKTGNKDEARRLFEQSLGLRFHPDVATALRRVGGTPSCRPCATQEDFD